jgi:hypothetical protein
MFMNTIPASRRFGSTFLVLASLTMMNVVHAQTTDSWIAASGKWEKIDRWDNGLPSDTQSVVIISNATSKVVTISAHTAHNFPDSLTITNLTVSAPDGVLNTLLLNNTGTLALHILNELTVGINPDGSPIGGSELISTKSTLVVDGSLGGELQDNGTIIIGGGSLITTNCSLLVASSSLSFSPSVGLLVISNAIAQARDVTITPSSSESLSSGTIKIIGGKMILSSFLTVGDGFENSQGTMLVANGGLLVVTNDETDVGGFSESSGSLAISNATFLAEDVFLGGTRSDGELTINNGTVTLSGHLGIGQGGEQVAGGVSLNAGKLVVTNDTTTVGGDEGDGDLTISAGIFLGKTVLVGSQFHSNGALSIQGGTSILSSNLQVGSEQSSAFVSITSGQLIVTNAPIVVNGGFGEVEAQVSISGGRLVTKTIDIGSSAEGALVIDGGSVTVSGGITLGDCNDAFATGFASVDGGKLTVANTAGTGFIDVQNGQLTVDGGVVHVDKLVMTNSCSSLVHTGGTLIVGSVILDTNSFGVTSIDQEGNDLRVTWLMGPGQLNTLQATSVKTHGHHGTNGYTDIFVVRNNTTPGVMTNYLDIGAATNVPPRTYRAVLTP